jgi:hypothetical protein
MKSSKFNENLETLKLQLFLGPPYWVRRCGSLAPKFCEGLSAPPKRPIQRLVGHHFGAPVEMLLGLGLARSSFVIAGGVLRTDERGEGGD